ncbi:MAG TPA: hypothetical protein VF152_05965 [Acidimicrobiia bacterium]
MGWCHEFGEDIRPGCDHLMSPAGESCHCASCATTCTGRFQGCTQVWARGPVDPDPAPDVHDPWLRAVLAQGTPDDPPRPAGPDMDAAGHRAPERDPALGTAVGRLRHELHLLEGVAEGLPAGARSDPITAMAGQLPRRIDAAIERAIGNGSSADLERMEQLAALVADTRLALQARAFDLPAKNGPSAARPPIIGDGRVGEHPTAAAS